jgi:hypothetical protein
MLDGELIMDPRAHEVNIVYEDWNDKNKDTGEPKLKSAPLSKLIAKLSEAGYEPQHSYIKAEDARKGLRDALAGVESILDRHARMQGAYQKDRNNATDELSEIRKLIKSVALKMDTSYEKELPIFLEMHGHRLRPDLRGTLLKEVSDTLPPLAAPAVVGLGPLRSYPPRHLAYAEHNDANWEAGGGSAWDRVRKDDLLRDRVNRWLGNKDRLKTPYKLDVRQLYDLEDLEDPLAEEISQFDSKQRESLFRHVKELLADSGLNEKSLAEFESQLLTIWTDLDLPDENLEDFIPDEEKYELAYGAAEGIESVNELSLIDLRSNTKVSHRDVGIGISQVLPVLVSAYASHDKIIAIEQPEIHLHPALQAELGDVFISSAKEQGNTFIIETHSEHLILRMMRRMRNTSDEELPEDVQPLTPEDIAVLYVQPGRDKTTSVVSVLQLDRDGALLDPFPGGFFEEGFKERFGK